MQIHRNSPQNQNQISNNTKRPNEGPQNSSDQPGGRRRNRKIRQTKKNKRSNTSLRKPHRKYDNAFRKKRRDNNQKIT